MHNILLQLLYHQIWLKYIGKWQNYAVSQGKLPILSVMSIVFTSSLLVALKRAGFDDQLRMQTWRWTELLQMLGVTIIGSHSHVGSRAFGWCVPVAALTKATFNSPVILGFGWRIWYFSSTMSQMWQSSRFKYGELQGHSFFSLNLFTSSAWHLNAEKRGLSWLKQYNFIIFQYIWTKLGSKGSISA